MVGKKKFSEGAVCVVRLEAELVRPLEVSRIGIKPELRGQVKLCRS
jgi:hypothetical protein